MVDFGEKAEHEYGVGLCTKLTTAFAAARGEGDKVFTVKLCEAARLLAPVYVLIFGDNLVSKTLVADVLGHAEGTQVSAELKPKEYHTIEGLVAGLVAEHGVEALRQDIYSGVSELLWLNRGLEFVAKFLGSVAEASSVDGDGTALNVLAREVYDQVLRPYHGWLVGGVVSAAFKLCPSKEDLMRYLGFDAADEESARQCVNVLLQQSLPCVSHITDVLERHGCNFPDKANFMAPPREVTPKTEGEGEGEEENEEEG
eukprot:Polyplicarium_translucidae@DN1481_c0_g1_i1.p1